MPVRKGGVAYCSKGGVELVGHAHGDVNLTIPHASGETPPAGKPWRGGRGRAEEEMLFKASNMQGLQIDDLEPLMWIP